MEGGGETTSWVQRTKESGIEEAIKIVHCCIEKNTQRRRENEDGKSQTVLKEVG